MVADSNYLDLLGHQAEVGHILGHHAEVGNVVGETAVEEIVPGSLDEVDAVDKVDCSNSPDQQEVEDLVEPMVDRTAGIAGMVDLVHLGPVEVQQLVEAGLAMVAVLAETYQGEGN